MSALWTAEEIAEATGGTVHGAFEASGVTFDSREVEPGHLFLALKGEATDGHLFLDRAFAAGASGAVVSEEVERPHVHVADTFAALNDLALHGLGPTPGSAASPAPSARPAPRRRSSPRSSGRLLAARTGR